MVNPLLYCERQLLKPTRQQGLGKGTIRRMKYEGMMIRPPSETDSLLLQVTVGCSHNRCPFCPTYKGERFRIKTFAETEEDIREAGTG